ncbi:MAG: haloacid dehalogenase-like hydrolase [Pseudomonadota bacterium]
MLLDRRAFRSSAYIAANGQGFTERALRLGRVAATAPLAAVLRKTNPAQASRIVYLSFRGMSEDRVAVLGQEYFNEILRPKIRPEALGLIERFRNDGHRVVLISELISEVVTPLLEYLKEPDQLVSNALEFRNGKATGRLKPPVLGGTATRKWLERFSSDEKIDLKHSTACAAYNTDRPLLRGVGSPFIVNPDLILRQSARESRWPELSLAR